MNEELLRRAIVDLANAILSHEYSKDMHNEMLIRLLAEGRFEEYAATNRDERPAHSASVNPET
jgi:hypothetical protein